MSVILSYYILALFLNMYFSRFMFSEEEARTELLAEERADQKELFEASMAIRRTQRDERSKRLDREEAVRRFAAKRTALVDDEVLEHPSAAL